MNAPDRLELLLAKNQTKVTGIDFVYVEKSQTALQVFFYHDPTSLDSSLENLTAKQISICSKSTGVEMAVKIDAPWPQQDGIHVMRLTFDQPGDFSVYVLRIDDERIDLHYKKIEFSFKAACENDLDCRQPEHICPADILVDFPVDYQARDFWSFRRALLDFAAQRYPDWQYRLEADMGMMLIEVMSALGDEFAYSQDRIAREAHLETASQRRSLRHHSKLIDYPMHEGLAASTWLDVTVEHNKAGVLEAREDVWAVSDHGEEIHYEIGHGLFDVDKQGKPSKYPVAYQRNVLIPHIWNKDETCLHAGATSLYVKGHHKNNLPFNDSPGDDPPGDKTSGRWVLLTTKPDSKDIPRRRLLVRVTKVEQKEDPLIKHPDFGHEISKLTWEQAQALPFDMDMTALEVHGNLVPAVAGKTVKALRFIVGKMGKEQKLPVAVEQTLVRTIERQGPNGTPTYLFSLPGSDETPLCWRGETPKTVQPEVRLVEVEWKNGVWQEKTQTWEWRMSFLGTPASKQFQRHFVLEDGYWGRVVAYRRNDKEIIHRGYAGNEGKTIRFGNEQFGFRPPPGSIFEVSYRLGNGRRGNLAAESLTHFGQQKLTFVTAISNPLNVANGIDAEAAEEVRQLAPDAFREQTYRAVQAQDYAEAAERLNWVQRAGARFRWTGSWLSAFVTPDPRGSVTLTQDQRRALCQQIDRFRQAGREAHVMAPGYADIDLRIAICVEPDAYPGQVKERVLDTLFGRTGLNKPGFFNPDNFTFGAPLLRSKLEAVIKQVAGVLAVDEIKIRRRGYFDWITMTKPYLPVSDQDVIRLENDPNHPERGTLTLTMEGGA